MYKQITVPATEEGLKEAAKFLRDYKKQMLKNADDLLGRMLKEGEVTARILLTHIDTGNTMSTIMGYRDGNHGMIMVGGNAIWIEFGTGVYAPGQTEYPIDVDRIVPHGTWDKGHGSDPNGWYYPGEDGKWKHTYGIPANMFMYNTAQMLRRQYVQMADELFRRGDI